MRNLLALVACAGLLTACGGTSPSPSPAPASSPAAASRPTKAITYTSGSADVTVTGAEQAQFNAGLDTTRGAEFTPDDGFDVWWRSGAQALNVSGDVQSGETDVFVRVETAAGDTHAYVDSFHTICDVVITSYTDTELAGSLTCPELPSFAGKSTVNVEATFSASS